MPYDSLGNWITPMGFEDYDQSSLFEQVQSGNTANIVTDMLTNYNYWDEFVDAFEQGDQTITNPVTGEPYEGGIDDIGTFISGYITPYDARGMEQIRTSSEAEKIRAREEMYTGTLQASKMAGKGGFSSGYASSQRKANLWDEYMRTNRQIDLSKASKINKEKGDYLDQMFDEIADTWTLMYGD